MSRCQTVLKMIPRVAASQARGDDCGRGGDVEKQFYDHAGVNGLCLASASLQAPKCMSCVEHQIWYKYGKKRTISALDRTPVSYLTDAILASSNALLVQASICGAVVRPSANPWWVVPWWPRKQENFRPIPTSGADFCVGMLHTTYMSLVYDVYT